MRQKDNTGKFIAFILRHHPEAIGMKPVSPIYS